MCSSNGFVRCNSIIWLDLVQDIFENWVLWEFYGISIFTQFVTHLMEAIFVDLYFPQSNISLGVFFESNWNLCDVVFSFLKLYFSICLLKRVSIFESNLTVFDDLSDLIHIFESLFFSIKLGLISCLGLIIYLDKQNRYIFFLSLSVIQLNLSFSWVLVHFIKFKNYSNSWRCFHVNYGFITKYIPS